MNESWTRAFAIAALALALVGAGCGTGVAANEATVTVDTLTPVRDQTPTPESQRPESQLGDSQPPDSQPPDSQQGAPVTPFTNIAADVLGPGLKLWNERPGVVVFDYDRDGLLDFYITAEAGRANRLYRNDGGLMFTDVGEQAGVGAIGSHSTGAVACDLNNDGNQDLYVGAWGDPNDGLDFRSTGPVPGNTDNLFLNNGDGTFTDVTDLAFGDDVNFRSATSIACSDVDGDGWLDLYVGNLMANDFRDFATANHAGHYNLLYINQGDMTFAEMAQEVGVDGPEVMMLDESGERILFEDPATGITYEGWDPAFTDDQGNPVGEATGQTHGVVFFDHDSDGDQDLWLANDGDRLYVYRNDSSPGTVRFTSIAPEMGLDVQGAWMGFAVGDYDGDGDLDVFIPNIGYHPRLRPPMPGPSGSCEYHDRFPWGTCLHFLLRNDGTRQAEGVGTVGVFAEVAGVTEVLPSPYLPPESLNPTRIHPDQAVPQGLAAYDFGFGTTFFDYDNDGDQDLYWLGSTVSSGMGPGGDVFPGVGRMLRADGTGSFEDITVRARLLDILGVHYEDLDDPDSILSLRARKINNRFHENGKGLAHGDLDGDGFVDLIGVNSSGEIWEGRETTVAVAPAPIFIWINGGGSNHWITLRLTGRMTIDGTGSNADGIGARVYLRDSEWSTNADGIQVQEVLGGSSYMSMDSLDLEFGLGRVTDIDEITVIWPSGRIQTLTDVPADRVLQITEPPDRDKAEPAE
jgi:enediyne biosynthesis protein E4